MRTRIGLHTGNRVIYHSVFRHSSLQNVVRELAYKSVLSTDLSAENGFLQPQEEMSEAPPAVLDTN